MKCRDRGTRMKPCRIDEAGPTGTGDKHTCWTAFRTVLRHGEPRRATGAPWASIGVWAVPVVAVAVVPALSVAYRRLRGQAAGTRVPSINPWQGLAVGSPIAGKRTVRASSGSVDRNGTGADLRLTFRINELEKIPGVYMTLCQQCVTEWPDV